MVAPRDMIGTVIRFDDYKGGKEFLLDDFLGEGADKLSYSAVPLDETDPEPLAFNCMKPQPFLEMRVLNYEYRVHAEKYPDHPLLMDPERRMKLLIEEMMERVRSPRFEFRVPLYRRLLEFALTVLATEFSRQFAAGELLEGFLENSAARVRIDENFLTVTDFGGIYKRPHVHSGIRWPQVLFQKQVIAKSLFLDLLTREAGKASHTTANLSKEPLFEGQTSLSPQNP